MISLPLQGTLTFLHTHFFYCSFEEGNFLAFIRGREQILNMTERGHTLISPNQFNEKSKKSSFIVFHTHEGCGKYPLSSANLLLIRTCSEICIGCPGRGAPVVPRVAPRSF